MLFKSGKGTVQRAAQAAVQSVVARSGKGAAQGAVQAAVRIVRLLLTVRWRSLGKMLCRVPGCCGGVQGSSVQGAVQAAVRSAVARSGKGALQGAVQAANHCGGDVRRRCCAVGAAVAKSGKDVLPDLAILKVGKRWLNLLEPAVPRTGNPCFQDWEAWVPTFGNC